MPFKSEAQRRYFEANETKLEKQGVDVKEWEEPSKGVKLPDRAARSKGKQSQQAWRVKFSRELCLRWHTRRSY